MFNTRKPNRLKAAFVAVALASLPWAAGAAGLGKVTVLSPLGQPLRAEVDISASRDELSSMSARLAPADAFKQAGIEFAPALRSVRVAIDKRSNGEPYLRLTSDRPVNEPFLDLLVELVWASGRLVREYTFLLDPPEVLKVPSPVAAPEVRPVAPAAAPAPKPVAPAPVAVPEAVRQPTAAPSAAEGAGKTAVEPTGARVVNKGDTLARIAAETKPDGVSLDQMLVALFQANRAAFDGANMNRLRAGKILSVPDRDTAAAVNAGEARKLIVAQAADFNAYRRKLAAVVAAEPAAVEAPKQTVAGKIASQVEDKVPAPAASKDKLEVSPTEAPKTRARIAALEEDLIARDKAIKEANSRIADLEKNLNDLKKLAELKSQAGAQAQQEAQAAKPAVPPPVAEKKAEPPVPAEKPAQEQAAEKPAAPAPEAAAPAPTPKPPAARKPVAPPPPEPEPPGFIAENPELVFGGGGILALLAGFLGYKAWRRKREAAGGMGPVSRITEDSLTANSVFGSTGGQSVDTSSAGASLQTDFGQSSMGAIDTDEGVDPVAEADVYMAYGRDAQAEEILIDALKNDPTRHAIHLKLLEIYLARKSLKQFETLASDLYGQTGGAGPDWDKAAAMGRSLDPANPLYGGGVKPAESAAAMAALGATTVIVPPVAEPERVSDTVTMPGEFAHMAAAAEAPLVMPEPAPVAEEIPAALDFDLDLGVPAAGVPAASVPAEKPAEEALSLDFDLDLGAPAEAGAPETPAATPMGATLDFDLDLGSAPAALGPAPAAPVPPPAVAAEASPGEALDFDFDLGEATPIEVVEAQPAPPAMDLSAVSLDLAEAPAAPGAEENPEVATKLELAQAYEEMGDKEGARELLQEVLREGTPGQQEAARTKLAQLEA